jgi:hypothetical protein
MKTYTVADLADGAGALELAADGTPVEPLAVVDLDGVGDRMGPAVGQALRSLQRHTTVLVGLSHRRPSPAATELLDRLTCTLMPASDTATVPPKHCVAVGDPDAAAEELGTTASQAPLASHSLDGLLRLTERLPVPDGLVAESLAYSMLLGGPEFLDWRHRTPRREHAETETPVLLSRDGDTVDVVLNRPDRHNAFDRGIRDGVIEAMELVESDDTITGALLRGNGPSFCSGGDLDEFGTTPDIAAAHLIRLRQSAGYAVHRVRDRVRVEVHGACIGAGVEVPSFAGRVEARPDAYFQLPELRMGLVPGAGGTVSVTRRIGRWRTAYLALLGRPVDVSTALEWGLVDGRA